MEWFYSKDGQQVGPVSEEEFQGLVQSDEINGDALVWNSGMADWQNYGEMVKQAEPVDPQQQAETGVCCECGQTFTLEDLIQYEGASICAVCKPVFFQRLEEGALLPGMFNYGGFWTRFGAKFVDGLIMYAVNMGVGLVTAMFVPSMQSGEVSASVVIFQVIMALVNVSLGVAYCVFFLGKYGATPGKMACKLKVIRSDGSSITYGRAFGRYFAEILSGIILNIGYLMAAFDDEKRTLHDRICDTRVIKVG